MKLDLNSNSLSHKSRLQWACRRGMLELDVLLGNFLREAYETLDLEDKELFIQLLACTDQELFSWLMGCHSPTDQGLSHLVNKIRYHARFRT